MGAAELPNGDVPAKAGNYRYHALTVERVIEETADARSLVFRIPEALRALFDYRPGQFLTLRVPFDGKQLIRCYSLASSPDVDAEHKVTVKRVDGGRVSNWLNDHIAAGDSLEVMPPAGHFQLRHADRDLVLFGGGSGITPVLSILKSALHLGSGRIRLVYANRDEQSVIFKQELREIAAAYPQRLEVVHVLDSVQGFLTEAMAAQQMRGYDDAEYFICGPGPFMDTVERALLVAGTDSARIHVERFVSPPDPDEKHAAASPPPASDEPSAHLAIELDGESHALECRPGETILQALQRAGLDAPSSCEEGFCGACMATLEEGEVTLAVNDILSEAELAEGWTLCCQARPSSATCKLKFPD
ncbi:MAG: ferredoxin--NADP reductase [Oceanospirillaceae bacterium]|nr:ferredoxin--NADP reductase [Oceanospirillaceae bacterium]